MILLKAGALTKNNGVYILVPEIQSQWIADFSLVLLRNDCEKFCFEDSLKDRVILARNMQYDEVILQGARIETK